MINQVKLLAAVLAGWISKQQQQAINYLMAENKVLKEKLGKKQILLNDDQRRRLAVKGKVLGRKRLAEIGCIFTRSISLRFPRAGCLRRFLEPRRDQISSFSYSG